MSILDEAHIEAKSSIQWADNQQAIFEAVQNPDQNILVSAVAGSGKTTTLVEAMKHAPGSTLFMAFNKAIAMEIQARTFSGDVRTLNALGHSIWRRKRPEAQLNARKSMDIIKAIMGDTSEFKEHGYTISRIVGLAKNNAFDIGLEADRQMFADLIDVYGFDVAADQVDMVASIAHEALARSNQDEKTFDFDDQLYVPVRNAWDFPKYDNIFVDECQDLSPIQHYMLDCLHRPRFEPTGRLVAVGDRFQAIYGFRGALTNSMDLLRDKFEMLELPLSTTYRCGKLIVEEARLFNPGIQAKQDAAEGEVCIAESDPQLFSQTMILCRNNAPLFKAILRHVRAKSPCRVMTNFLDSFQSFIRGFKTTYTSDLNAKLDRWFEKERGAALSKGFRGKVEQLRDKYETAKLLAAESRLTEDIIRLVKRLGEGTTGPTFATIHKAKGLEHDNVYILRPDLMPAFYATTNDQKQQEANLQYVAITRAKLKLTYGEIKYG